MNTFSILTIRFCNMNITHIMNIIHDTTGFTACQIFFSNFSKNIILLAMRRLDKKAEPVYIVYMKLQKKFMSLSNGETYAYLDEGQGKAILFLHGNMSSSLHYLPLLKRIEGYRLIAPDLRGFGDSSYHSPFSSLGELAEDVKLFADGLGISSAHLAGWSTGGGIAFELAARYPDLVRSVFCIEGVGHRGYPLFKNEGDTRRAYSDKEEMAGDPVSVAPPLAAFAAGNTAFFDMLWDQAIYPHQKPGPEDNKLFIAETLKERCLVDVDWALANFNMSGVSNGYASGDGTIGKISCPVACTSGVSDYVVPPDTIKTNTDAIPGAQLLVYENCGHSPLVDCPDRLAADLLSLIARAG
jgi:pimeloyl-ACP methyl ester carboxylesterase